MSGPPFIPQQHFSPMLYSQQNAKSTEELLEQNESLMRSSSQMRQTPKNEKLVARMNMTYQVNKAILESRGVKI